MFGNLFNDLTALIGSKVQEAVKELTKGFAVPEAEEPFTLIRQFAISDPTVTKGGIAVGGESWQIEAYDDNSFRLNTTAPLRKVILFEIAELADLECVIACDFKLKHQIPKK